jgi:hypothetical protein
MPLLHHRWRPPANPHPARDDAHWLRARIASMLIDWPGVTLEEIACTPRGVRLAVRARDAAAAHAFVAAVEAELGVAMRRRTANGEQRTANGGEGGGGGVILSGAREAGEGERPPARPRGPSTAQPFRLLRSG